jgi:hypothetical protein
MLMISLGGKSGKEGNKNDRVGATEQVEKPWYKLGDGLDLSLSSL